MLSVRRPIVHKFAATARETCGDAIEEIILFGSVARGDDRPDSDIDILVITSREDFRLREYLAGLAFDMLSGSRSRSSPGRMYASAPGVPLHQAGSP
jgi:predicted nucleotidyltransferase